MFSVVHSYKRWNHGKAEYHFPKVKGTEAAIRARAGIVIPGTGERVSSEKLDWRGLYDPARWSRHQNYDGGTPVSRHYTGAADFHPAWQRPGNTH